MDLRLLPAPANLQTIARGLGPPETELGDSVLFASLEGTIMSFQMRHRLIAADLFCGAGGLSVGFARAGYQIAFANDVNEECRETYVQNHPGTAFFTGSIEDLTAKDVFQKTGLGKGEIDVLIGGPPCQGFSINAPKRSLEDSRNQLFRHYGRLVLEGLRPKAVLMENVSGMLSLEGGRFVDAIYSLFGQAGYRMECMVLCAAHYGVPQERWRLFFVGTILMENAPGMVSLDGGKFIGEMYALFGLKEVQ